MAGLRHRSRGRGGRGRYLARGHKEDVLPGRSCESLHGRHTSAGMIMVILVGAFLFNYFCAKTLLPDACATWITGFHVSRWTVMTVIIIIYFFLGMVMEAPSIQILTLPVFWPILITSLGFDPVWFGVIQVRMLEITLITPPLGMVAYVISGVDKDLSLTTVFRGCVPFLLMELVTMPLFMFVTPITMWLPNLLQR